MHRGDRHGPALDDQLSRETQGMVRGTGSTRAEEWKEPEPTGDIPMEGREPGSPPGMEPDDVEARSEVAKALAPLDFPTTTARILDRFDRAGVRDDIMAAARDLPGAGSYGSVHDVVRALGIPTERHRT